MRTFLTFFTIVFTVLSFSQEKCISHKIIEQQIINAENSQTVLDEITSLKTNSFILTKASNIVQIPVVFHIVHNGDLLGQNEHLTDATVLSQLERINKDFRAFNADTANIPNEFKNFLADTEIQFCLAKKDTIGNFTTGIIRHNLFQAGFDENEINNTVKPNTIWNREHYLNIWSFNFSGSLATNNVNGYATPPFVSTAFDKDGIVLNYTKVGNDLANDIGRTLVHEIGHWLGLFHIWGDDNGSCTGDDGIADTPNQGDAYQNCPSGTPNSCGSNDMYINYMDYTDADCAFMFTEDQKIRIHSVLNGFRSSIQNSPACTVTDVIIKDIVFPNGTICQEYFIPAVTIQNIGNDTIFDYSVDFFIDNVLKTTFSENVTIAPNEIIYAKSSQTFSNNLGVNAAAKFIISTNAIEYSSNNIKTATFSAVNTGAGFPNLSENFENNSFPPTNFFIQNTNNDTTWSEFVGNQNKCIFINNNTNTIGNIDAFSTTDFDALSVVDAEPFLHFEYLYKAKPNFNDTLTIYFSIDCGVHWYPLWSKGGLELSQNIIDNSPFIYNNEALFKDSINLTNITHENGTISKVRFLFENKSGGGNNLYIDNIEFEHHTTAIENTTIKGLSIFPNPTNDVFHITQEKTTPLEIELISATGKIILNKTIQNIETTISLKDYIQGIYFLKISSNDKIVVQKILKQ